MKENNRWIPVTEKLPELCVDVLCTGKTADENGNYYVSVGFYMGHNVWMNFDEVIAWMPLPAPYKEDAL